MSLPLTSLVENTFENIDLHEQDVISYENQIFSTAQFDLSGLNNTNYEINVNLSTSDLIAHLDEAYHLICWRQVKADGAAYGAYDAGVAGTHVSNAGLTKSAWSFFKNYRVEVNNETLDSVENPGEVHNILYKAGKSRELINVQAPDQFYYPAVSATDVTDPNYLLSATRARALSRAGFIWSKIYLKDVLGCANLKKVLPNCNFVFRMNKETNFGTMLFRNAGTNIAGETVANVDSAIDIKHIRLVIPCLKVKDRLLNTILSKSVLEKKMIPLDWMQIGYQKVTVKNPVAGQLTSVALFSGVRKPRSIWLAPQLPTVSATQTGGNPSIYTSNNMTEMYIQVNGRQFPFHRYTPEAYGYQDAVDALRKSLSEEEAHIFNTLNFKSLHSIYYFDISKVDSIFEENGSGPVIQINFTSSDNADLDLHCVYMAERHNALQFMGNSMRVVSVEK